nr:hypothetical protein [Tanacetum cinerariifolium]
LGYENYNKTANVTPLQETSDENKALSLPSEKRKIRQGVDGLEVIVSALDKLNNDSRSGNLSLELLGDSFRYLKKRFPDEYKLCDLNTETSDENKALSRPSEKRKIRQGVDGLEVIVSALDQLNNDSHSGNLSLELLDDSF